MAGQEHLYLAAITALRADAALVTLTGHTATSFRIARASPPVKGRSPFLGVLIPQSLPLVGKDCTRLQQAELDFYCHGSELQSLRIADRVEVILNPETTVASYWDFSDTNVSVRQSRFRSRQGPMHDEASDIWSVLVVADIVWINESC